MPITQNVIIEDAELPATLPCMVGAPMPSGSGTGFTPSPVFSPLDLSGLVLWLRADLGITIATGVSAWADQSGQGHNVTQATGGSQPTFNAVDGAYNGASTLSFLGSSSQYMRSAAWSSGPSQPLEVVIVGDIAPQSNTYFFDGAIIDTMIMGAQATNRLIAYAGTTRGTPTNSYSSQVPCVFSAFFNGASSFIYLNNSQVSADSGNIGTNTTTGVTVGASGSTGSPMTGKIAEVVIYEGGLTLATRRQLFVYLGQRYGIATS